MNSFIKEYALTSSLKLKFVDEFEFNEATSEYRKEVFQVCLAIQSRQVYSEEEIHLANATESIAGITQSTILSSSQKSSWDSSSRACK